MLRSSVGIADKKNSSGILLKHIEHFLSDVVGERVEILVERHALRGHGVEDGHSHLPPVQSSPDRVQNLI